MRMSRRGVKKSLCLCPLTDILVVFYLNLNKKEVCCLECAEIQLEMILIEHNLLTKLKPSLSAPKG